MTVCNLRAMAVALLLGTGAAGLLAISPAMAAISAKVGKPLQEAQSLAGAGNYRGAMAKVNEAAAAAKSAEEKKDVDQMRQFIAIKSGDASIGGALGAKAKFANDYSAHRYKDVIADGEGLRKSGALDSQSMLVIAQSYYLSGDKTGCINYIKRNFGKGAGEDALQLLQRCAYDANDDVTQREALESLVARTGKPEYWTNLLKLTERARGLSDQTSLDILRLKLLTGSISGDDYNTGAELALSLRLPAVAQTFLSKGIDAKAVPNNERTTKLMNTAKQIQAQDQSGRAKALDAAQKAATGDALVTIGREQVDEGDAKGGLANIKAGLAKPVKNMANAQIGQGYAEIVAGQKDAAIRTLGAVKGTDAQVLIAHLYTLYARR